MTMTSIDSELGPWQTRYVLGSSAWTASGSAPSWRAATSRARPCGHWSSSPASPADFRHRLLSEADVVLHSLWEG